MNAAATPMRCPLCDGTAIALDPPHESQAMLSDGRIVQEPLAKISCLACGATAHRDLLSDGAVRALYDDAYSLATAAPGSDLVRARNYAGWIANGLSRPASVLEVGCGSGALLRQFAEIWPDARCLGIDPAAPSDDDPNARVVLRRGFLDALNDNDTSLDLIVAVNVIEHTRDPKAFLSGLAARLADDGTLAIVCPSAMPPNVELLFYDHLWTLTPAALEAAAGHAGLRLVGHDAAPPSIGDFQLASFRRAGTPINYPASDGRALAEARHAYLRSWLQLDTAIAARMPTQTPLRAFGAGQAAALLRAYAPRSWTRIESLILDDLSEAWALDKPVSPYDNRDPARADIPVLIATAARSQAAIARRLTADGFRPIRWDDLISQ